MKRVKVKRGDTINWLCLYTDNVNVAIDITNIAIAAQIRSKIDVLLTTLTVTKLGGTGQYKLSQTAAITSTFSPGIYFADIEYTDNVGIVLSTETIEVEIPKDYTYE